MTVSCMTFDVRDADGIHARSRTVHSRSGIGERRRTNITAGVFPNDAMGNPPLYDVKDLSSSFDGKQLVFAMRAPEIPNADPEDQPTWNIWLYDVETNSLRRVISSDITAEIGQDVAPHFLPDGRIVFASTRQRDAKAVLLDEGKPQFAAQVETRDEDALSLHVMDADGANIHQISFNQSHDMDPSVLADGRIVYARWDNAAGPGCVQSVHDESGRHRAESALRRSQPRHRTERRRRFNSSNRRNCPMVGCSSACGRRRRSRTSAQRWSPIDTANYIDHDRADVRESGFDRRRTGIAGAGQRATSSNAPSPRGRFASVAPLYDGSDRLLVTWSQCRLLDPASPDPLNPVIVPCTPALLAMPGIQEAPPLYGVWMFDRTDGTQQPLVTPEEGFAYTEAAVMEARTPPVVRLDKVAGLDLDPDLVSESVGELHIRSVYDIDGTATPAITTLRDPALDHGSAAARAIPARGQSGIASRATTSSTSTTRHSAQATSCARSSATRRSSRTAR